MWPGRGSEQKKREKGGVADAVTAVEEKGERELNIGDLEICVVTVLLCGRRLRGAEGAELETVAGSCVKFLRLNDDCGSSGYIIIHLHRTLRPDPRLHSHSPSTPLTILLHLCNTPKFATTLVGNSKGERSIRSIIPFMSQATWHRVALGDCGPICLFFSD